MGNPVVYLAGPIAGETLAEAGNWRIYATAYLQDKGFVVLDPLRGKYEKLPINEPLKDSYSEILGAGSKTIFARDRFDVSRCDIVLANLGEAKKISIGTVCEITQAFCAGKFIVLCDVDGSMHDHPFVRHAASMVVPNMPAALIYLFKNFSTTEDTYGSATR